MRLEIKEELKMQSTSLPIFSKRTGKNMKQFSHKKKKRFNIVDWTFLSFTDGPDKAIDVTSRVHLRFEFQVSIVTYYNFKTNQQ